MKPGLRIVVITAASIAASFAASAAGTVEVKFTQKEQFIDAGRTAMERERYLGVIEAHLKALGSGLADGQKLSLEILDVDLAGTIVRRGGFEVRTALGRADWPRITLRYSLEGGGRESASGEETVDSMGYLNWVSRSTDNEELPYEKQMLTGWFKQRFLTPPPQ